MARPDISPPRWRIAAAFIVAPFVAATAMACYEPLYAGLHSAFERIVRTLIAYCFLGAYPTAILFGLPAFLYLRSRVRPTAFYCALTGAFVAAMPWLLLLVFPVPDEAVDGGHVTVLHGHRTLWWWLFQAQFTFEIAAFGVLGGLAFWLIAVAGLKFKAAAPP